MLLAVLASAQTPHPRLLFTSSDVPALQAKVNASGTPAAQSYAAMVSSAGLVTSSSQHAFVVYRGVRRMTEVAFRYQMTGYAPYGDNAKTVLLQYCNWLTPTSDKAYLSSTYPCALALTYDLVYDRLSASERATVVAHLESWVTTMRNGTNGWTTYASFVHAVDNYAMAWCTGISFTLMAIEGDSGYSNLQGLIEDNLGKLEAGWNDAISPDGSVDEAYGYASYGNVYSIHAGVAALNCGYGDRLAGKNILKTPRWLSASLAGDTFVWIGDSSPTHKGNRIDPVVFYPLQRSDSADPEAFWGLNRIYEVEPISNATPTHALSANVNRALYYPHLLTEQVPEVLSGFFRDNLNQGSAWSNKLQAYPEVGEGGHAFMHNSTSPSWTKLSAYYLIRDEWMTHNHEDDGHFSLAYDGVWQFLDIGYASSSTWHGAQTTDHNIVLVQGASPFGGAANNYYNPPPNARFLGQKKDAMVSPLLDYVRGEHDTMWMMDAAERSVIMIKEQVAPYTILIDRVRKDGATHTYEEVFHSAGPASGQGTTASPMTIAASGVTLRSTWLSPSNVNVVAGSSATNAGTTYCRNKVTATGVEVTFLSVHGGNAPLATTPLSNPLANTVGGVVSWASATDTILVRTGPGAIGDSLNFANAQFAWVRHQGGQVTAFAFAEGTSLTREGSPLVSTNKPMTLMARDGRVFAQTLDGSGANGLVISLNVNFTVTEFVVDGAPLVFSQLGNQVTVGGSSLPGLSSDDRAYTFTHGYLGDAVPSANAVVQHGALTSTGGWGSLKLKDAEEIGGRPFTVGMHVRFRAGAAGAEGGFKFETSSGAGDVLTVLAEPYDNASFKVVAAQPGATSSGEAVIPYGIDDVTGRFYIYFDPTQGTVQIRDVTEAPLASFVVVPVAGTFKARAVFSEYSEVDDITLFDSMEDGQTPQGVAFYANQNGYAGMVLRAPQILLTQQFRPVHNGFILPNSVALLWYINGGLYEFIINAQVPFGSPAPPNLGEAGLEFSAVSVLQLAGHTTGMWMQTGTGFELFGAVSY